MTITREEAIQRHRELWGWLAETGEEGKFAWPEWEKYGIAKNRCFLCEFTQPDDVEDRKNACENCPCVWPNTDTNYFPCEISLYTAWQNAETTEERKALAAQIRDLPAREVE